MRALKLLLPSLLADAAARERFAQEARVTGSIDCAHIIDVLDAGIDPGTKLPFLVTELLEGHDLGELLARDGPLAIERLIPLVKQIARGLDSTAAQGIAHRDLKPENLFLHRPGDAAERAVILDFGIAKSLHNLSNKTDAILGTPLYAAPEQVQWKREEITPAVDRYALAMVVYTLLVGEAYFVEEHQAADSTMQFFLDVVTGTTEAPTKRARRRRAIQLPLALDAWFERATAIRPADRHGSALELANELEQALAQRGEVTGSTVNAALTVVDGAIAKTLVSSPLGPAVTMTGAESRPAGMRSRHGLAVAAVMLAATAVILVGSRSAPSPSASAPPAVPLPSAAEASWGGTEPRTRGRPAPPEAAGTASARTASVSPAPNVTSTAQVKSTGRAASGRAPAARTSASVTPEASATTTGWVPPLTER
jgi:serine/threonine-protein kinase